jgi:hypothetical protein
MDSHRPTTVTFLLHIILHWFYTKYSIVPINCRFNNQVRIAAGIDVSGELSSPRNSSLQLVSQFLEQPGSPLWTLKTRSENGFPRWPLLGGTNFNSRPKTDRPIEHWVMSTISFVRLYDFLVGQRDVRIRTSFFKFLQICKTRLQVTRAHQTRSSLKNDSQASYLFNDNSPGSKWRSRLTVVSKEK